MGEVEMDNKKESWERYKKQKQEAGDTGIYVKESILNLLKENGVKIGYEEPTGIFTSDNVIFNVYLILIIDPITPEIQKILDSDKN